MTTDRRHIDLVLRVFKELVTAGAAGITPGAVNTRLRELGEPMGTWEVRGAFTTLETDGAIVIDVQSGAWYLAEDRAKTKKRRGTA
jgi:hypothetical protein